MKKSLPTAVGKTEFFPPGKSFLNNNQWSSTNRWIGGHRNDFKTYQIYMKGFRETWSVTCIAGSSQISCIVSLHSQRRTCISQGLSLWFHFSSKIGRKWKWSNGVGKSEISIIWCISITNNVKSCKKIQWNSSKANFTDFPLTDGAVVEPQCLCKWLQEIDSKRKSISVHCFCRVFAHFLASSVLCCRLHVCQADIQKENLR